MITTLRKLWKLEDLRKKLLYTFGMLVLFRLVGVIPAPGIDAAAVLNASSADSLRNLRTKYPKLFLLLDGYDYPNANAKNCSNGFDKFGHGAAACVSDSVTSAWKQAESDGSDFVTHAVAAAERMKKNLTRYIQVL